MTAFAEMQFSQDNDELHCKVQRVYVKIASTVKFDAERSRTDTNCRENLLIKRSAVSKNEGPTSQSVASSFTGDCRDRRVLDQLRQYQSIEAVKIIDKRSPVSRDEG